jgi:hypothetical protein
MFEKDFSHGHKFTGYMDVVASLVNRGKPGQKILLFRIAGAIHG